MTNINSIKASTIKYLPSQELINFVKKNMQQKTSINIFTNQAIFSDITDEQVSTLLYNSVTGFLATVSQGLAYGDGVEAILSQQGQLNENVLQGFLLRIPVTKNIQLFSQLLYKNLIVAAKEQSISSEFGKLVIKNNELILERIKVIQPKDTSKIKRAEISRIG